MGKGGSEQAEDYKLLYGEGHTDHQEISSLVSVSSHTMCLF
jgi:hypothetical protein